MEILVTMSEIKQRLLVHEARRWVGTKEVGGNNKGQCVEMFQRAVDNKAAGEPWCLAFVQFCCDQADGTFDAVTGSCNDPYKLVHTEHCLTLWKSSPSEIVSVVPAPGLVAVWRHGESTNGHVGIVTSLLGDTRFMSIEGNTKNLEAINREGDGVVERERSRSSNGSFKLLGFLKPWA